MQIEFIENYDLDKLKPADYNPRKLQEEKFTKLQESIKKFGMIKPLIINGDNGILTAGHQRTRALKSLGITTAPVIRICGIKIQDEIKFNLFHNSIETNKSKVYIKNYELRNGYCIIQPDNIYFDNNDNATVVKEIGDLIMKYGEWGCIVSDEDGNVILNSDYAVASKQLNKEVICYVIKNKDKQEISKLLSIDYGDYNYDTLGIKSYNQLYCQMNRLTKSTKKLNMSTTYENFVIPVIDKEMRILDFGAGKCAYVNMLRKQGFKIFAYEPNFQTKSNNIDIRTVVSQIKAIEKDVEANGLYDLVILDSVYNSVVNSEVENYVSAVCNAFLKKDGKFITGTRNLEAIESKTRLKVNNTKSRCLEFLDKENFGATFRNGVWTMQHFHTLETLKTLLDKYFYDVKTTNCSNASQSNIYAICSNPKPIDLDYLSTAIEFELNMEYPNKYKHNQHIKLKKLILNEKGKIYDSYKKDGSKR